MTDGAGVQGAAARALLAFTGANNAPTAAGVVIADLRRFALVGYPITDYGHARRLLDELPGLRCTASGVWILTNGRAPTGRLLGRAEVRRMATDRLLSRLAVEAALVESPTRRAKISECAASLDAERVEAVLAEASELPGVRVCNSIAEARALGAS